MQVNQPVVVIFWLACPLGLILEEKYALPKEISFFKVRDYTAGKFHFKMNAFVARLSGLFPHYVGAKSFTYAHSP